LVPRHQFLLYFPALVEILALLRPDDRVRSIEADELRFPWTYPCRHAALKALPTLADRFDSGKLTAFRLVKTGQFGNNWRQFLAVIVVARLFAIRTIYVTHGFLRIRETILLADRLEIRPTNKSFRFRTAVFRSKFFITFPRPACPGLSAVVLASEIREHILRHYLRRPVDNSTLYLFVRSGDVFKFFPEPSYGQPPCRFYLDVMEHRAGDVRPVIISQDKKNPCVDVLIEHGAYWRQQSFDEDFATMVYCTKLAVSMSTLSPAVLQLSPVRKQIFMSEDPYPGGQGWVLSPYESYHEFDNVRVCTVSTAFASVVLRRWTNSRRQRQAILNGACTWTAGI
jgi:hypothetical protein